MLFSPSVEATDRAPGDAAATRTDLWWAAAAYACIAVVTVGGLVAQTGTFFRGPDWAGLGAFHDGPSLEAFDGTLSVTSGAVFGVVAPLAEWTFWPYRVVAVIAVALALVAIFQFTRRVAGPEVGVVATAVLASFTHAMPLLAEPFTMRIPLSVAMTVALVGLLDTRTRRGDVAALVLFAGVLATSLVGLAAVPVVAVTLLAQRTSAPRWAAFSVPPVLWLAWFAWRGSLATEPWSWTSRGQYVANLVGRSFQHLACNSATLGAVAAAGVVAVLWTDPERRLGASWRPARWLAGAVAYIVVTTYRNGSIWLRPLGAHPPDTDSWIVAALVVLAVVESVRHRHRRLPESSRQAGFGAFGVAIALSSVTLAHALEDSRSSAPADHGVPVDTVAAIDSLAPLDEDSWSVSIDLGNISARHLQDVQSAFGSLLDAIGITPDDSEEALRIRDQVARDGLGIRAEPGDCQWSSAPADQLDVVGPRRVIVASLDPNVPLRVQLSRLARATADAEPLAVVESGQTAIVTFPGFEDGRAWTIWVDGFGVLGTCVD